AIVAAVSYKDVSERIRGDVLWPSELAICAASATERFNEGASVRESLNAVVSRIGDIDETQRRRDSAGRCKLSITRTACSPFRDESSARSKSLNSVIAGVGNLDVIGRIHRNPLGKLELTIRRAAAAPTEQRRAGRVKLAN